MAMQTGLPVVLGFAMNDRLGWRLSSDMPSDSHLKISCDMSEAGGEDAKAIVMAALVSNQARIWRDAFEPATRPRRKTSPRKFPQ